MTTVSSSRIAEYPIGSLESRAAARSMLNDRGSAFPGIKVQFVPSLEAMPELLKRACVCPPAPAGKITFCYCFTTKGNKHA